MAPWSDPDAASVAAPTTNRLGWLLFIVIVGAVGLVAWALLNSGTEGESGQRHMIYGSVLIHQPQNFTSTGTTCSGRAFMADMVQGAYVGVGDTDAEIIGSARLTAGVITPEGNCRLSYTVAVPDRDTFLFVIGDRAAFSLPATVLNNNDWVMARDWDFQ